VVDDVKPGSRAAHAGLEAGDVILEMNKKKVQNAAELQEAQQARPSGEHLLYIERKGGTSAIVTISAE
jgi:S1-C subfamily serine protease